MLTIYHEWSLIARMRDLAPGHEHEEDLVFMADRLADAYRRLFREPQAIATGEFLTIFTLAVALWSTITGEDPGPEVDAEGFERLRFMALLQAAPRLEGAPVQ